MRFKVTTYSPTEELRRTNKQIICTGLHFAKLNPETFPSRTILSHKLEHNIDHSVNIIGNRSDLRSMDPSNANCSVRQIGPINIRRRRWVRLEPLPTEALMIFRAAPVSRRQVHGTMPMQTMTSKFHPFPSTLRSISGEARVGSSSSSRSTMSQSTTFFEVSPR